MARFDDGELYVELEDATRYQAHRALLAARRKIADAGVEVGAAIGAMARRGVMLDREMAWEAGDGPEPRWLTDEENDLADLAEDAEVAARVAACVDACRLGLMARPAERVPVVRDLFEAA